MIGAFIIVVCASAVNGTFVKSTPKEKAGLQKEFVPVLPMASAFRAEAGPGKELKLQVQQWTESRHLSWA